MTQDTIQSQLQDARLLREHLGQLNHNELLVAQSTVRVVLEQLRAMGLTLVPVEPTQGLLMSMAVRSDHGLGCPGYYDQELLGGAPGGHQRRVEVALSEMRKLHEEVVGSGFHRPEHEARYMAMLSDTLKGGSSA